MSWRELFPYKYMREREREDDKTEEGQREDRIDMIHRGEV